MSQAPCRVVPLVTTNDAQLCRLIKSITPAAALETSEREIEDAQHAGTLGFMSRLLVQATLPHRKSTESYYKRTNGSVALSILVPPDVGLPFGTYPRMLLSWITTEAVRTKHPELELGGSLSQFMAKLGLAATGGKSGTVGRLRDHCVRLFSSTIAWTYQDDGSWSRVGVQAVEQAQMFWDPKRPDQLTLGGPLRSYIRLSSSFYEEVVNRPVPLDLRVLKRLAQLRSPLAIDIYTWLTYRVSYLRAPIHVQWEWLAWQFGSDYSDARFFKRKFVKWLTVVRQVADWRDLNVEPAEKSLLIRPSLPHVLPSYLS